MDDARKILAIESSGRHGSVATLWGQPDRAELIGQIALAGNERTAQALAPALKRLLRETGLQPAEVRLVAVAVGPGSFTGLRIGVTTAKAFAYAIGAEVVAVNTLDALAEQASLADGPLWTILDAQRQELFAAKYRLNEDHLPHLERELHITAQDAWLSELVAGDRVTGPALTRLAKQLPANVATLPSELWQPMAEAVGRVGWRNYCAGQCDDVWQLAPVYYRPSAAEEKNPLGHTRLGGTP